MKKLYLTMLSLFIAVGCFGQGSVVYFTKDITPESLVKIYEALGVSTEGKRVAVKISTGESSRSNYLRPAFIQNLVQKLGANIVECNTAYGGSRGSTSAHRRAIAERGFNDIATVDIMDEAGMPVIEQSPLVMECEVIDTYEIDGFKNYICNVLNTYVEEDKLDEKGKPDYTKLKPVLFEMPTYKYLRTGDIIGDCVKMGKAYGETLK